MKSTSLCTKMPQNIYEDNLTVAEVCLFLRNDLRLTFRVIFLLYAKIVGWHGNGSWDTKYPDKMSLRGDF